MSVCTKAKIIETISADDHLILIMENLWIPQSDIQISTTYGESFRVGDIVEIEVKKWTSSPITKGR